MAWDSYPTREEWEEANRRAGANGEAKDEDPLPPPPDRSRLILSAWLDRDIPPRDYLLGGVMCTTSRWFIYGETGIGKTLFGMEFTAAIAAAAKFLRWPGQRRARVMYLDGEMPVETFKERMELIAARYGRDLEFHGYNREDGGMPPLNTPVGQAWLWREIDAIKPDIIVFDSIMCLLTGAMKDEETWAPMKPLVCKLSARRVAQIWLNHANDIGKSYGDKTREWEMDTVAKLSKVEGEDGAIQFEFAKARLRTPRNADQFEPMVIRPADDWAFNAASKGEGGGKGPSMAWIVRSEFMTAYDRLANDVTKTPGFDGAPVAKVATAAITAELKTRGDLPLDEKENVTQAGRRLLATAKAQLLKSGRIMENEGMIWKI
jgi:hypothetical protein